MGVEKFQKSSFLKKKSIFCHFWGYAILIRDRVKLNADSEFLVHFVIEPHFIRLKWTKSLKKSEKETFFVNILMANNLPAEKFYMYIVRDPLNIKNIIAFNLLVDIFRKKIYF